MTLPNYLDPHSERPTPTNPGPMRCPECNTERPLSDFKRYASLAQTRSWLKNPQARNRLLYTGKVCNPCHRKQKRTSLDLTPSALHKRLVNEGLHPLIIQDRVNARIKRGSTNRLARTSRTKLQNARPELRLRYAQIDAIGNKFKNKLTHLRRINEGQSEAATFCWEFTVMLDDVKHQLKLKAKAGARLPDDWHVLISDKHIKTLEARIVRVPDKHRNKFLPFMHHIRGGWTTQPSVAPAVPSPINKGE